MACLCLLCHCPCWINQNIADVDALAGLVQNIADVDALAGLVQNIAEVAFALEKPCAKRS